MEKSRSLSCLVPLRVGNDYVHIFSLVGLLSPPVSPHQIELWLLLVEKNDFCDDAIFSNYGSVSSVKRLLDFVIFLGGKKKKKRRRKRTKEGSVSQLCLKEGSMQ